jgi:hypothetical protein
LDKEVKRATARRDKAAAMLAAEDAALEALLKAQAELFEAVAAEHRLPVHRSSVNTRSEQMQLESRIAISKGRSARSEDPFFVTIRAAKPKGFTLRSLAKRIGEQPSLLSMQRKGDRPIPRARAEEIAKLTGWPADAKHWPGGLS